MYNELEKMIGDVAVLAAVSEGGLNANALAFRRLLVNVQNVGHLRDLGMLFLGHTHTHGLPEFKYSYEYMRLCSQLAARELEQREFVLGLGLLAPALQNRGWAFFNEDFQRRKANIAKSQAVADEALLVIKKRQEQITKIDAGSSKHQVRQRWVAPTRQLLVDEADWQLRQWPPGGYGTTVGLIAEEVEGEHAGKFVCRFSRGTSSD